MMYIKESQYPQHLTRIALSGVHSYDLHVHAILARIALQLFVVSFEV